MKVFIVGFVNHNDIQANEIIQAVYGRGVDNLVGLIVNQVPVQYNYGNQYAYITPAQANITSFPAVVFLAEYEPGKYTDVAQLTGRFSTDDIVQKVRSLKNLPAPNAPGDNGIIPTDNPEGNGFGFNLIPTWVLVAVAAGSGYKAYNDKGIGSKVLYGGVAAYLVSKLLK